MMTMGLRVTGTAVWLYEETGSGADLAWLGIIELGMRIPANLYGGALADEVDRKKLMAATQFQQKSRAMDCFEKLRCGDLGMTILSG